MIAVRKSVFETNSSAQHSIAVMKGHSSNKDIFSNLKFTDDGYIAFSEQDLQFDRYPFRLLTTFADKLRFAIASVNSYPFNVDNAEGITEDINKAIHLKEIEDIVVKCRPQFNGFLLPAKYVLGYYTPNGESVYLSKVTKEEYVDTDGKKRVRYFGTDKNNPEPVELVLKVRKEINTGYIETDYNLLPMFLEKKCISLEKFLLDSRYFVIIDGDEYNIWDKFIDMGLVNKKYIDNIFSI